MKMETFYLRFWYENGYALQTGEVEKGRRKNLKQELLEIRGRQVSQMHPSTAFFDRVPPKTMKIAGFPKIFCPSPTLQRQNLRILKILAERSQQF